MKSITSFARWLTAFGILTICGGTLCFAQLHPDDQHKPHPLPKVDVRLGIKIPMRDKVKLQATIYRPEFLTVPVAAIVSITPYMADSYHDRAMFFAQHGYVFVVVDCRGRGNSEGVFEPFANEGKDGYDVVEWVAKQKWCNGKVGMWGGSYAGYNQWSTLKEFPPHLKTIIPVASPHPGVDFPAPGGIVDSYFMQWITYTTGRTLNLKLFNDHEYWIAKFRSRYFLQRPFKELDKIVGNPSPHFQKWIEHREPDSYWDAMVPDKEAYQRMDIPILSITSHYDSDQRGAMEYFHRHMRHGSAKGKDRHFLIMGPWDHAGTRHPEIAVGGLKFGEASVIDMDQLHKSWFDWHLKGGSRPVVLRKRIISYVAGEETWQLYDRLKDIPVQRKKFFLDSRGPANDAFRSGTLREEKPGKSVPDKYVFDPLDVRPAAIEKEKIEDFITDQRYALNLFGNGLVYHTDPLPKDTEIAGYVKFVAWIKLNVPDTDFQATLYEIKPDGTSIFLTKDRLRARYRESFRKAKLLVPGSINCFEFQGFTFISRMLKKQSRLRLVFSSPNSIYQEKNYNSGGRVECETREDSRIAQVTLFHDTDHPSYLELPICNE